MKHTPGPWEARSVSQRWTEILGDEDKHGNKTILATVQPAGNDSEATWTFPQRDANARLIAAAPQLLEACKAIAALSDGQGRANMLEVASMARAAITKSQEA